AFEVLCRVLGKGGVEGEGVKEDVLGAFFVSKATRLFSQQALTACATPEFPFHDLVKGCEKAAKSLEGADVSHEALVSASRLVVETLAENVCASKQKDVEIDFFVKGLGSQSYGMRQLAVLVLSLVVVKSDAASRNTIASTLLESIVKRIAQLDSFTVKKDVSVLPKDGRTDASLLTLIVSAGPSLAAYAESLTLLYALNNIVLAVAKPDGGFAWLAEGKDATACGYKTVVTGVFRSLITLGSPVWSESVMKLLFRQHVGKESVEFCTIFWTDDDLDSTITTKITALNIATTFIRLFSSPSTPMKYDFQLVIPSLLVALTNTSKLVRNAALECFAAIKTCYLRLGNTAKKQTAGSIYAYDAFYGSTSGQVQYLSAEVGSGLVAGVLGVKDELLTDERFVERLLHSYLVKGKSDNGEIYKEDVLSFLVTNVLAMTKAGAQVRALQALRMVDSGVKIKTLYPVLESNLAVLKEAGEEGRERDGRFELVAELVRCFTARAVAGLFALRSGRYVKIFVDVLRMEVPVVSGKTIQQCGLEMINPAWFDGVGPEKQLEVFGVLVDLSVEGGSGVVADVRRILKGLNIGAELVLAELGRCRGVLEEMGEPSVKKLRKEGEETLDVFFRMTTLLELLETKSDISSKPLLIAPLFELLSTILNLDTASAPVSLEYIKQLILSALLSFVDAAKQNQLAIEETSLRVDLIVQCIRVTDNPQTINGCLMLMASIAVMYPEQVLLNVVPVFTFMGASVLRQDDNYSSHVIQQTLETILPPLVAKHRAEATSRQELVLAVKPILEVFVDALFHIPKHRRQRLFTILITTLDESTFLDSVIVLLLAKHTSKNSKMSSSASAIEGLLEFTLQLCGQFKGETQLKGVIGVLEVLMSLPDEKSENDDEDSDALEGVYDVRAHLQKELRQFKLVSANFVGTLLGTRTFASKIGAMDKAESEGQMLRVVEMLLGLINKINGYGEECEGAGDAKYAKALSGLLYETLGRANALLGLGAFLTVVKELLRHDDLTIRRKAMDLLNAKVDELSEDDITDESLASFRGLVEDLRDSVVAKIDAEDVKRVENKQAALICLTTMVQRMGQEDLDTWSGVAKRLCDEGVLAGGDRQVLASVFVCLTAICIEIGARILPVLPKFVPAIIENIKKDLVQEDSAETKDSVLLAALASLDAVVDTLPQFVSPYIPTIVELTLHPSLQRLPDATGAVTRTVEKSNDLLTSLAQKVAPRVVLPAIFNHLKTALSNGKASLLGLFGLVGNVITHMPKPDLVQHHKELFRFFLVSFDYRRTYGSQTTPEDLILVENSIISSFLSLVMKLNETLFKPLFLKTVDWATSDLLLKNGMKKEEVVGRQIFFYRLLDQLMGRLKGIVAGYFGYVFESCLGVLREFRKGRGEGELWVEVVKGLGKWFLYDHDALVTGDKYDKLLTPLVGQIAAVQAHGKKYLDRMTTYLIPCLGQLAVAAGSDVRWKPLNHQILMHTRNENPVIRLVALKVLNELYERLGEEMLVLFPETIPFLAELMEDDEPDVEKACRDLCGRIQQYLGEPIEQYFTA
ncbi:HEAT repeat-containing protein 1, partial [Rhizophlyctis rosea]